MLGTFIAMLALLTVVLLNRVVRNRDEHKPIHDSDGELD
jgi:hypothetical protein